MKFCIDTSAWLDGWARDYPPDVFPSLWEKIDELIKETLNQEEAKFYDELEEQNQDVNEIDVCVKML